MLDVVVGLSVGLEVGEKLVSEGDKVVGK